MAIFWAFFHSALTPTVELGAQWPPLGIEPVNPFELPLLNTVNFNTNEIIFFVIAVWVQISLYTFIIHYNFKSYFILNYPKPLLRKVKRLWFKSTRRPTLAYKRTGFFMRSERSYSSINSDLPLIKGGPEFYKWFSGFTDAEGSFNIVHRDKWFGFTFSIGLHIDDLSVLNYIKSKLEFGNIYSTDNVCYFNVTKKEDILKLINIFDIYFLNTTKRFDFLDFKKAYYLYYNRDSLTYELTNKIVNIKNNMNKLRNPNIDDTKPLLHGVDGEFNISKEWFKGFIEGDGSFSLSRNTMEPVFSIKLTEKELPLLYAIKKYLINNACALNLDKFSVYKLKGSSIITIGKGKAVNNSKPLATFTIKNVHFFNNVFIPFLDESQFISKKGLDFKDFKVLCHTIYIGGYRIERIRNLLLKLSMTMNDFRLSTFKGEKVIMSSTDFNDLLTSEKTIQHLSDGRELDIKTQKLIHRRSSSSIYEILKLSNPQETLLKQNLADSAKEIGVGFNTLKKRLDNEFSEAEFKGYKIKRIGVLKKTVLRSKH